MGRATRTFKLRLSPAGMDVFIDSHCHLIRATRCLIAWGTTLHVAVNYLDTVSDTAILDCLRDFGDSSLSGNEEHHVGASHRLCDVAARIVERVQHARPDRTPPTLGTIYILALQQLTRAEPPELMAAFEKAQVSFKRPSATSQSG